LREGKIIQVVPDSTDDTVGDRPLAIGGRRFHIKPGLAEYALLTGAAIVPQFSTRRLDGSVHTAFQPPIEIPPSVVNREDRVFSILEQYAAFVDRSWRLAPEGLNWKLFEKIFLKPRVSDPPSHPQASGEAHPEPDAAGSSGGIGAPD
jgi:hypothetical protein